MKTISFCFLQAPVNPDQIDPALLAGAAGPIGGIDGAVDPSLLAGAADPSLVAGDQGGFAQENVQYAAYGAAGVGGQVQYDQQAGFAYQQAAYSNVSTAEEPQYGGK